MEESAPATRSALCVMRYALFVTQGINRVQHRRAPGGPEPEDHADEGTHRKGHSDRLGNDHGIPAAPVSERPGAAGADRDAEGAAGEAEDERLDEELQQHVGAARAEGLAHADLAGALGDRDQHDVHDADAADRERYERDP